jgi:hypothetical protein
MVWDLYVDESGSFAEDKHCLVGGFIVPEGTVNRDIVLKWKDEICKVPEISELMMDLKWKYDHCMRNTYKSSKRKTRLRGELQYLITKEYKKKLQAINGKFVIFDNSTGIYNTDNTTNFLTVLAKGLMMLFYEWPEPNPSIRLHFASRKNITYSNESELLPVSPTRIQEGGGDQPVIQTSQYIAQIRNLAFLQSGQELLENGTFSSMLDNIDIVQDDIVISEDNEEIRLPNPLTVPSDYICNTFIKADGYDADYQSRIRQLYSLPNVLIYRTDRPLMHAPGELKNIDSDENYGKIMLRLISYSFREPETSRFFRAFNKATIGTQKSSLNYVIDSLRERVESQETMEQLADRYSSPWAR